MYLLAFPLVASVNDVTVWSLRERKGVQRSVWEISAYVSLTSHLRCDTGRSLLCYKGCTIKRHRLFVLIFEGDADEVTSLLYRLTPAKILGPKAAIVAFWLYVKCCSNRKHGEGMAVINFEHLSWSELILIGSVYNNHISIDSRTLAAKRECPSKYRLPSENGCTWLDFVLGI